MNVSQDEVIDWCSRLIEKSPDFPEMEKCLKAIPDLESLSELPAGTRVLIRGDTDVVVEDDGSIEDDVRLRSLLETLQFGLERGWVQLIYGHRGRDPRRALAGLSDANEVDMDGKRVDEGGPRIYPTRLISELSILRGVDEYLSLDIDIEWPTLNG